MQASNRTVFGREFKVTPLWMWILQRASGLLLGPLVALHVWTPALASNRALNAVLLAVVLAHGYSGLRRIAVTRDRIAMTTALAWAWCVVVLVFGAMLVLARP
jgi:succinate dehydrogenase hydrophobic anchor subunit